MPTEIPPDSNPCISCLTFPVCLSTYNSKIGHESIRNLRNKCSLLRNNEVL